MLANLNKANLANSVLVPGCEPGSDYTEWYQAYEVGIILKDPKPLR